MPVALHTTVPEVPVNPDVLKWARTLRGLSREDAADLLEIPLTELSAYESGAKLPLVGLLRLMSARYRINFTSLLMPDPLPSPSRPVDHRARRGQRPLSIDTLIAIEEVEQALESFAEIAAEAPRLVPKASIGEASLEEDPEAVAARERKKFGIGIETQQSFRDMGQARREWREQVENRGVFTYMIPMPTNELSGFSLLRDGIAAICVNDREPTEGAKIFTLFHEYCHLLLRRTGISDQNNFNKVERFCNRFAASFLVPRADLLVAVGSTRAAPYEFSDGDVRRMASRFLVSNAAIALRLQETGLAPRGFYGRRIAPWDVAPESKPMRPDSAPSSVTLRIKRIGKLHTRTVIRAAARSVIDSFDASDLIGLKPATVAKLQIQFK
ncbi:MAG TPA: XRE family transcriptional regulator [Vicinamibacterales bacterium]|nr:XRE family transcriptional regulator [Vicinamibacterales bacterium]